MWSCGVVRGASSCKVNLCTNWFVSKMFVGLATRYLNQEAISFTIIFRNQAEKRLLEYRRGESNHISGKYGQIFALR